MADENTNIKTFPGSGSTLPSRTVPNNLQACKLLGTVREGNVLPDPGKVFMLVFSSAMIFDSSPKCYLPYVNFGDVGDKSKKTGGKAPVLI